MLINKEYSTDEIPKGIDHQRFKRLKELFIKSVKLPIVYTYEEISKRQKNRLKKITKKCMRKWNKQIVLEELNRLIYKEKFNEKIYCIFALFDYDTVVCFVWI